MIDKLILKNWRTHKESELEFGKGTNVIVGVMGSGKSSLVNAICYSLFGTFPALKSKQVSLNEIIMNKPNQCDKSETKIIFSHGEKKYSVERTIKFDGTNEAKLFEGEKLVAGPKQKDVNEKVEHLLGLSYELFSRAVYSEQNEMDFFLRLSPGDRKKKFDELLELSKYEEARKNTVILQNQITKDNKQRKELVEQQKETMKNSEEGKIIAQIKENEKEILVLEKKLSESEKKVSESEEKYKKISEKEKENKKIEDELIKLKSQKEGLEKDLEKSEGIPLEEIKIVFQSKKEEISNIKKQLEKKEKELEEVEKKEKTLKEELGVFEYQKKTNEKEKKEIAGLKGKCPTCKQELDIKHKEKIEKELIETINKIEKEMEKREKEKHILSGSIFGIKKEIKKVKEENEGKLKELYKIENMEKEAKQVKEKKEELDKLIEQIPKTEKELKEINFNSTEMNKTREEYYNQKNEREITVEKIKSKKELINSYKDNYEKLKQVRENIFSMEKEITKNEEAVKKLSVFNNCLVATQQELREAMLETTNIAMTKIWGAIYPYKDYLDARLQVIENGYDLQVQTRNNGWVRVEGILSGGERSAAALCIRIAFALVLTKQLSMLILDEPTHNLDVNAVEKLSNMLREEIPTLVDQTFVITHDKQLENAASSNLYMLERNKDSDEPTKVEVMEII